MRDPSDRQPPTPAAPARRHGAVSAAVAVVASTVALTVAGCSTAAPTQGELAEAFEVSGLSEEVADCAASALRDNLSDDELALLVERGGGGAPEDDPDDDEDSADQVRDALTACRELTAPATTVPIGGVLDQGSEATPDSLPATTPESTSGSAPATDLDEEPGS